MAQVASAQVPLAPGVSLGRRDGEQFLANTMFLVRVPYLRMSDQGDVFGVFIASACICGSTKEYAV
jgi:hypothetical protein